MQQAFFRAWGCIRRPWVALLFLGLAGGGAALVRLPLLGSPGYELSEALSVLHGLLAFGFGLAAARQERNLIAAVDPRPRGAIRLDSPFGSVVAACFGAWLLCLAALGVAFAAALAYAATSTTCDPAFAIGFFPVLTLPSSLLGCACGVFSGFLFRKLWASLTCQFLLLGASLAHTLWPIVFGPQIYAFNHLLGWVPGPLYDEMLVLPAGLWWFRLETLLAVVGVVLFTANLLDMRLGVLSRPHFRLGSAVLLLAVGAAIFTLEERGAVLGTRMTDQVLAEKLGGRRETDHFVLHHPRSMGRDQLERIVRDLEFRHEQVSNFFGAPPPGKVTVWWYRDAAEKQRLVGAEHTHFAKPWRREVHVNDAHFPHSVLKHELVHAMAAPFGEKPFGVTAHFAGLLPVAGVIEGLAVAADDPLEELTLHEWAAGMKERQLLPDVRSLMRLDGFYKAPPARAYAAAGSFLRWLGETRGGEKLRALYRVGAFEQVYSQPLDGLVGEWEKFLATVPLDSAQVNQAMGRFRRQSLFQRACAREVEALRQTAQAVRHSESDRAVELYRRIRSLQPDDYRHWLDEASALEAGGHEADARAVLDQLATQVQADASAALEVEMARADLAWHMGRSSDAETHLKKVLELTPTPQMDRTARVKLSALQSTEVGPAIWQYFEPGGADVKLLVLREALAKVPGHAEAAYLIGRKIALNGDQPNLAVRYLSQALAAPALPASIRREALRVKWESRFLAGDCAGLREEAKTLPDYGTVFKRAAEEWLLRCDFEDRVFKGPYVPPKALR